MVLLQPTFNLIGGTQFNFSQLKILTATPFFFFFFTLDLESTPFHARLFVGVDPISKSILQRPCQFLAINAHKMAPRTSKGLQERAWDALVREPASSGPLYH